LKNKSFLILFSCFILAFSLFAQSELVGPLSKEEILKHYPEWNTEIASYFPKPEILEKLRNISSPLDIQIYLGTWCPDCRENVSAYFKIMEMTENPNIHTQYFGIPRDRSLRQKYAQELNIEKVPTFIIMIDGIEIGRIIEHPKKSLEEDLLEIIMH
jgi:thiol-disulfide isomerase/thioredoxin